MSEKFPIQKFPVKDHYFHERSLRKLDEYDITDVEVRILIAWHCTAINYLDYGAYYDMDGPAAVRDGKPVPIKPEFQLGIDPDGNPFMRHFPAFTEYTLERFDVQGVTLRDVTIRVEGDKVTYRVPDAVDQGGAIRQIMGYEDRITGDMLSKPVLKSDIKSAVELHYNEGGISE